MGVHAPPEAGWPGTPSAHTEAHPIYGYLILERGELHLIAKDVKLKEGVVVFQPDLVNLYGCDIGAQTRIGAFVEIQKGAKIGARCKISSHTFICEGVRIEDGVFVGHGVVFINDAYPKAVTPNGELQTEADWTLVPTHVGANASIGSNATILCGIDIGEGALVGAGAVVTRNVPDYAIVAGVPAHIIGDTRDARSVQAIPEQATAKSA
jgi:UDP-2-acetamido-3-amino-2,3-dideoxy-glucuronate N-acetyltransferase